MAQPPSNPYYQQGQQPAPVNPYPQPPPYSAQAPQQYPQHPPPQQYPQQPPPQQYPQQPLPPQYAQQPPPPQYAQQSATYVKQPPPPHGQKTTVQSVTYVKKGPAPPAQRTRKRPPKDRPHTEFESAFGGLMKSLERGASHAMNATEKAINRSIDHHTASPTLAKFASGNVISLISKSTRQYLRVLPNGGIDALGQANDPACHFSTWNQGMNVVMLRSISNPTFHLSIIHGLTVGMGTGNNNSKFRIHEKPDHHVTFEWVPKNGNFIRIHPLGQPAATIGDNKSADTEFWVNLLSGAQVIQK